jgi:adenylate kinase family enzyme
MLREEVAARTPLGLKMEETMKAGNLLPSATMIALLKKKMSSFPGAFVALDGFPRSRENYLDFDAICGAPEFAISIEVPDEVMMDRMLKRGQASGRVDDNPETAKKRIQTFHAMGDPTLACLRENGVPIYALDGNQTVENVWDQLMALNTPLTNRVIKSSEQSS